MMTNLIEFLTQIYLSTEEKLCRTFEQEDEETGNEKIFFPRVSRLYSHNRTLY